MEIKIETSARALGRLRLGDGAYIAQGAAVRSMDDSVKIGAASWVLENSVVIGSRAHPVIIGSKTVFGHKCTVIGAQIGDLCEVGNSTIFMPGSRVGDFCIFGEGTLIPENALVPSGSVVVGRPYRIVRRTDEKDRAMIQRMRGGNLSLPPYEEHVFEGSWKGGDSVGNLYWYKDKYPQVAESAIIYDSAEITGDVVIGENSVIASGVRILGTAHGPVRIGNNVQILENTVLHLLPDNELVIQDGVTIGPNCMIHGTTIGENSVIEPASIVCDYSRLGKNTLVKVGSLVKQRSVFEDNAIVKGFPAKPIGKSLQPLQRPAWGGRAND